MTTGRRGVRPYISTYEKMSRMPSCIYILRGVCSGVWSLLVVFVWLLFGGLSHGMWRGWIVPSRSRRAGILRRPPPSAHPPRPPLSIAPATAVFLLSVLIPAVAMLKSLVPRSASRSLLRPVASEAFVPSLYRLVPRRAFASEAPEHDVVVIGMLALHGDFSGGADTGRWRSRGLRRCHQGCSGRPEGAATEYCMPPRVLADTTHRLHVWRSGAPSVELV